MISKRFRRSCRAASRDRRRFGTGSETVATGRESAAATPAIPDVVPNPELLVAVPGGEERKPVVRPILSSSCLVGGHPWAPGWASRFNRRLAGELIERFVVLSLARRFDEGPISVSHCIEQHTFRVPASAWQCRCATLGLTMDTRVSRRDFGVSRRRHSLETGTCNHGQRRSPPLFSREFARLVLSDMEE